MRRTLAPSVLVVALLPVGVAAADRTPRLFGADTLDAGEITVGAGGGLALLVPSAGVDVALGVGSRFDMAVHYDTYLGIVHNFGYEGRLRLARGDWRELALACRAEVNHAFWSQADLLDLDSEDLPGGNGTSLSLGARLSFTVRQRVRVSVDLSSSVQVVSIVRVSAEAHEAQLDLHLRAINAAVHAEWPISDRRAFFLKVAGIIPIAGRVTVIGYIPVIELGWSFDL